MMRQYDVIALAGFLFWGGCALGNKAVECDIVKPGSWALNFEVIFSA